MKKLFTIIALAVCVSTNAQTTFMLTKGMQLIYEVEDGGKVYDLTVTVESVQPLTFSYATPATKGTASNATATNGDGFSYRFTAGDKNPVITLSNITFNKIKDLVENNRDKMIINDTTTFKLTLNNNPAPTILGGLSFMKEMVTLNDVVHSQINTYSVIETRDVNGKPVDFGAGIMMRVQSNEKAPVITYILDQKGDFTFILKEIKEAPAAK